MRRFRLVVNLITLNAASAEFKVNPIDVRALVGTFARAVAYAQYDGTDAFTQVLVEPRSQCYFGIGLPSKHGGTVVSTRLLQGWVNAPAWLQYGLRSCFDRAGVTDVETYVDDMAFAQLTYEAQLRKTREFLALMRMVDFKLKPTSKPFTRDMVFCGLRFRTNGAGEGSWSKLPMDVSRLRTRPMLTGADLAWALGVFLWFCGTVAYLNRDLEPLRVVMRAVQGQATSAKSRSLARVLLDERNGWTAGRAALVAELWDRVEYHVALSLPVPDGDVLIFTDASALWWAFVVFQVRRRLTRPVTALPPVGELEMLYLGSGMFSEREQRWDVREREACAAIHALDQARFFLLGRSPILFTDHKALVQLFMHPDSLRLVQSCHRVQRWVRFANRFRLEVAWVAGSENVLADALTRTDVRGGAAPLRRVIVAVVARARRPHRTVLRELGVKPQGVVGAPTHLVQTDAPTWAFPTLETIRDACAEPGVAAEAVAAGTTCGRDGLYRYGEALFLPHQFRPVMVAAAHAAVAGHRATSATMRALRGFWWPDMEAQVLVEVDACYSCMVHRAPRVARPFGDVLYGTSLGEVLCADFFEFPTVTWRGREVSYLLVFKDSLSGFVTSYVLESATSTAVSEALIEWILRYHLLPRTLLTDGGSHFQGVLTAAVRLLFLQRRWSIEYAPWSNGAVERVGRDIINSVRRLLVDGPRRFRVEDWPEAALLSTFVVNNTPSETRGDKSPAELFLGRVVVSALDLVGRAQEAMGSRRPLTPSQLRAFASALARRLETVRHDAVESVAEARAASHRRQAARPGVRPLSVVVGDWVLVSREAYPAQTNAPVSKLTPDWFGPVQVVAVPSPHYVGVRVFGRKDVRRVSASHVQFFHGADLALTAEVRDLMSASVPGLFIVRDIVGARYVTDRGGRRRIVLLVKWAGYDDEPATEQDLHQLYAAVPESVEAFLAREQPADEAHIVADARRRLGIAAAKVAAPLSP